jgi:membrane protease YdiL (CAAX protease family)
VSLPVPPRPDVGGGAPSDVTGRPSEHLGSGPDDARPRTTWGPLEGIGVWLVANLLIGGILVYSLFAAVLELDDVDGGADADVLLASAAIALVTVAILWLWLRTRHPTWRAAMGLEAGGLALRHLAWGAVAGLILYPVISLGVGLIVVVFLEALSSGSVETPEQLAPGLTGIGQVLAVAYGFVIAPIAEEFFFRGVLFRSLADRRGFWTGAIVSGLLFGIVHLPVGEPFADALVLPLVMTFTGIGLAWIYERRRSLLAPIGAHMVFNAIGLALIFSGVGG